MTASIHQSARHLRGWKRDMPGGHADLKVPMARPGVTLPQTADMRPTSPAVYDQGHLGSCTANATGFLWHYELALAQANTAIEGPSRLYIYYWTRVAEGEVNNDAGGTLRGAMKAAHAGGLCPETLWPYVEAEFAAAPSNAAEDDAAKNKPTKRQFGSVPQQLQTLAQILAGGHPIAFGFSVPVSFMSDAMATSGVMTMPTEGEQVVGGHAVALVGYDTAKSAFLVRNSWGTAWGEAGYFWMPFAFACDPNWCGDFWTVVTSPAYD